MKNLINADGMHNHRRPRAGWVVALCALASLSVSSAALRAQEKSLLWTISREGKSTLLLGSIHYLRRENYPLSPAILDAFDRSKRLVLEVDLSRTTGEAAQRVTLEKAMYRDGTSLAQNVSAETYELASRRAGELGLDMRILNPMKPWFAALTLLAINLQRMGMDPKLGVDRYLAERAKSGGKPTSGLETVESQLSVVDQLTKREQELMLRAAAEEVERLHRHVNEIVQSWLKGDEARLAGLLLTGMRGYPELYDKVLVERNRRWAAEIGKLVDQGGGAMVVVGAAHLVGSDSVLEMLKAKGYSVEQQ
jgi:uncharacterized protein YbaP (TraB family)